MSKKGDFAENKNLVFICSLAIAIGFISTYVAKLLLNLIYLCTNIFYFQKFSLVASSPAQSHMGMWAIFVPMIGGLIIGLMARFGTDRIRGHGIPEALEAILFGKSKMSVKVALLKPVSSAISIGSGGPFGAEGPIIMTGGAFGSIIAQKFHLTASERKTLLVAGAAAGMTAIFGTPVAAVLLGVELLLFEWKPRSMIPVALASAVAAVMRVPLFGSGPLFAIHAHAVPGGSVVALAAAVGLVTGMLCILLSNLVYKFEDLFSELPIHWMWWPLLGGLVVGVGGYFQPRALGVGYDIIADLLNGSLVPQVILGLIIVKCVIWSVSLGSGTSGGVLAPLLIMGGGIGGLLSHVLISPSPSFWPLVAMAAVLGGMMRSPFMGAVFALELTADFNAFLPLLVASVASYGFTVVFMKRSILTEKVARRGFHIFCEYGVDFLERAHVKTVMTRTVETVPAHLTLQEAHDQYFGLTQKHLGYPVVGSDNRYLNMITREDFLKYPESEWSVRKVGELPVNQIPLIQGDHSCREANELMAEFGSTRLPVVAGPGSHELVGIVTLSDLLKPKKSEMFEERFREGPRLPLPQVFWKH